MTLRTEYYSDLDSTTKSIAAAQSIETRQPLHVLPIAPSAISPDGSNWLHAVEATYSTKMIRIRVIGNNDQGVNVLVPCLDITMYQKYRDLRCLIRNTDRVLVTFPRIFVNPAHPMESELYLLAHDFKVRDDAELPKPRIKI